MKLILTIAVALVLLAPAAQAWECCATSTEGCYATACAEVPEGGSCAAQEFSGGASAIAYDAAGNIVAFEVDWCKPDPPTCL